MMSDSFKYRITFLQQDKLYEVYANYISEETLMGFIEIEELIFDQDSDLLVNPADERMKTEFKDVKRSYIPMHTILRIDEVSSDDKSPVKKVVTDQSNISHLHRKSSSEDDSK